MRLRCFLDAELALWANPGTARQLRIQYPGAICRAMHCDGRREAIFEDNQDRRPFLKTLAEACRNREHLALLLQRKPANGGSSSNQRLRRL